MKLINRLQWEYIAWREDVRRMFPKIVLAWLCLIPLAYLRTRWLLTEYGMVGVPLKLSILDGINALFRRYFMPVLVCPLFLFVISEVITFDRMEFVTVRFLHRRAIWAAKAKKIVLHAFFYLTSVVIIELIVGASQLEFTNSWRAKEGIVYTIARMDWEGHAQSLLLQRWNEYSALYSPAFIVGLMVLLATVGLSVATFIVAIVVLWTDRLIAGYGVFLLILFLDSYVDRFSLIFKQATIEYVEWLNLSSVFWDFLYLIGLLIFFYAIGSYVSQGKDYGLKKMRAFWPSG